MIQNRRLLIFPGSGDPTNPAYAATYTFLGSLALQAGYSQVDSEIRWPGQHSSSMPESPLLVDTSVQVATTYLQRCSDNDAPYDILCRSFGCFVGLETILQLPSCFYPKRLILWAPIPYWSMFDHLVTRFEETRAYSQTKGVNITEMTFPSVRPIELLLDKTTTRTVCAYGSLDRAGAFHLGSIISSAANRNPLVQLPRVVRNADHEVTATADPDIQFEYSDALFSDDFPRKTSLSEERDLLGAT